MSDVTSAISPETVYFSAFSKVYLQLIDGLTERKLTPVKAASTALELVNSYLNYANNNKFAEIGSVMMVAEEGED